MVAQQYEDTSGFTPYGRVGTGGNRKWRVGQQCVFVGSVKHF